MSELTRTVELTIDVDDLTTEGKPGKPVRFLAPWDVETVMETACDRLLRARGLATADRLAFLDDANGAVRCLLAGDWQDVEVAATHSYDD